MRQRVCLLILLTLSLAVTLAGCDRNRAPVTAVPPSVVPPTVAPPAVPLSTATAPVPEPSPQPTSDAGELPAGWQRATNDRVSIAIPPGWVTITLSGADIQTVYDEIKRNDSRLAKMIGSPEALQGTAFWAFGSLEEEFADNVNIRRSPLGSQRVTDMQQVIDVLLPEFEKIGLSVTSTDATLSVHGFPAARVTYTYTMSTPEGHSIEVRGRQVLLATVTDLWILSFATTAEREGAMAPLFEQSAQSFEPK